MAEVEGLVGYLVLVGGGQNADVAVVPRPVLVLEHPHGAVLLLLHLLPPGAAGGQEARMEVTRAAGEYL